MRCALACLAALALLLVAPSTAHAAGVAASTTRVPLDRTLNRSNAVVETGPSDGPTASAPGVFLQRDPAGYQDSVNLYAAFANDPVNKRDPTGRIIPALYGAYVTAVTGAAAAACFGAGFVDELNGVDLCPGPADELGRVSRAGVRVGEEVAEQVVKAGHEVLEREIKAGVRVGEEVLEQGAKAGSDLLARARASIVTQLKTRLRQLELGADAAKSGADEAKGAVGVALEQGGRKVTTSPHAGVDLVVNGVETSIKGPIPLPHGDPAGLARSIIKDLDRNSATKKIIVDLRNLTREQVAEIKRAVQASGNPTKAIEYLE